MFILQSQISGIKALSAKFFSENLLKIFFLKKLYQNFLMEVLVFFLDDKYTYPLFLHNLLLLSLSE